MTVVKRILKQIYDNLKLFFKISHQNTVSKNIVIGASKFLERLSDRLSGIAQNLS